MKKTDIISLVLSVIFMLVGYATVICVGAISVIMFLMPSIFVSLPDTAFTIVSFNGAGWLVVVIGLLLYHGSDI